MKKIINLLIKFWPILAICLVSGVLFLTNFAPGTYLLGWDSTVPEFNLLLNLQRFFFGVWQEYRGLGTLDGMAHTSNIIYWIYTAIFSFVLPQNIIRYILEILFHLLGGLGIYMLVRYDVLPQLLKLQHKQARDFQQRIAAISLISALLYMLNLMTIQMFYTPLELFSIHFAVLPWGIYSLRRFFKNSTKQNLFFFFLVNLLGVSQAHVPTIFIAYAITMAVFLIVHLFPFSTLRLRQCLIAGFILIAVNAFWTLPYSYSAVFKSAEISNAKQNRLGTDGTFYRNSAWGGLKSIMTFGGFQLDYQDWSFKDQKSESIMINWVRLYNLPFYQVITILLSAGSFMGILLTAYSAVRYKSAALLPYLAAWFIALIMLGTNIPVIADISAFARNYIPFFYQVFRFTFTKFALTYACFVSVGLSTFLYFIFCYKKAFSEYLSFLISVMLLVGIGSVSFLAFVGFFFYPALKVKLPDEYQQLIEYLNNQPETNRVATFPIHSLWGWTTGTNGWGYRGSGFIWQAIKQPLVDRSFDPWSKYNETEFLQMNRSLYTLDNDAFLKTFQKFFTSGIYYDQSIFQPGNYPEALFKPETNQFLDSIPEIQKQQKLKDLTIYNIQNKYKDLAILAPASVTFISSDYENLYTTRDQAFIDHGEYIQLAQDSISYPFSILQRDEFNKPTTSKFFFDNQEIKFLLQAEANQKVIIPSFAQKEKIVPTLITSFVDHTLNTVEVSFQMQLPEIILADGSTIQASQPASLSVPFFANQDYELQLGSAVLPLNASESSKTRQILANANFFSSDDTNVTLRAVPGKQPASSKQLAQSSSVISTSSILSNFDKQIKSVNPQLLSKASINFPFSSDPSFKLTGDTRRNSGIKNCKNSSLALVSFNKLNKGVEYSAKDKAAFCDTYFFPELNQDAEYLYYLNGQTISGAGMSVFLLNPTTKRFDIYTGTRTGKFNLFIPVYPSQSYTRNYRDYFQLSFNGETFGQEENKVDIFQSEFYPLPLKWLSSIYVTGDNPKLSFDTKINHQSKLSPTFYTTSTQVISKEGLIVLPQSFDAGWLAFSKNNPLHFFPHVQYNGWANSWLLPQGQYDLIIVYWPQFLSFIGYLLLIGVLLSFILIAVSARKNKRKLA